MCISFSAAAGSVAQESRGKKRQVRVVQPRGLDLRGCHFSRPRSQIRSPAFLTQTTAQERTLRQDIFKRRKARCTVVVVILPEDSVEAETEKADDLSGQMIRDVHLVVMLNRQSACGPEYHLREIFFAKEYLHAVDEMLQWLAPVKFRCWIGNGRLSQRCHKNWAP